MRRKLVAGNWKMHGSLLQNEGLLSALLAGLPEVSCEVAVFPPFPYLAQAQALLDGSDVRLGAQMVNSHASGALTGEVSLSMLVDFGCRYVLVGHSERRMLFGETDSQVVEKCKSVLAADRVPVLCVGETLLEREAGKTQEVVRRQVGVVLDALGVEAMRDAVVAYEPVWAIGTGVTATPEQAQAVHADIRALFAVRDVTVATDLRILYGGSVKSGNAGELFKQPDIDGGLVGAASLDARDFLAICRAAN